MSHQPDKTVIAMYKLMVKRSFVAQHYLTVPGCGPENEWHSHHFEVEVLLEGGELNEHGYLTDIDEVKRHTDHLVSRYEDATLNDQPAFEGLNPSVEHFARIFCASLCEAITTDHLSSLSVRMWEDREAWALYRVTF